MCNSIDFLSHNGVCFNSGNILYKNTVIFFESKLLKHTIIQKTDIVRSLDEFSGVSFQFKFNL